MLEQLAWLKGTIEQLLPQAQRESNARLYGELVLDNLPPFFTSEQLLGYLKPDDWFEKLAMLDPRVKPFEVWFTKFRNYCRKQLERDIQEPAAGAQLSASEDPSEVPNVVGNDHD